MERFTKGSWFDTIFFCLGKEPYLSRSTYKAQGGWFDTKKLLLAWAQTLSY